LFTPSRTRGFVKLKHPTKIAEIPNIKGFPAIFFLPELYEESILQKTLAAVPFRNQQNTMFCE
ncbi:hypothetical protein, partial [Anaerotignum lactatifermentans]